jgi:hypothetical protein
MSKWPSEGGLGNKLLILVLNRVTSEAVQLNAEEIMSIEQLKPAWLACSAKKTQASATQSSFESNSQFFELKYEYSESA